MTPKELKLKRELAEAKDKVMDLEARLGRAELDLKKQDDRVSHYMSTNCALWLDLSTLPGGLELARKRQVQ